MQHNTNNTVDILAEVTIAESPVQSATIKTIELSIKEGECTENLRSRSLVHKIKHIAL